MVLFSFFLFVQFIGKSYLHNFSDDFRNVALLNVTANKTKHDQNIKESIKWLLILYIGH